MNEYSHYLETEMCDCCGEEFHESKLHDMENGDQYCKDCLAGE